MYCLHITLECWDCTLFIIYRVKPRSLLLHCQSAGFKKCAIAAHLCEISLLLTLHVSISEVKSKTILPKEKCRIVLTVYLFNWNVLW